jgi:hypothetical protein
MENEKRKMVILESTVHKKIKHRAVDNESSIQDEVNEILKKELGIRGDTENESRNL